MNEALKQFSKELADALKAHVAAKETSEFINTVKASGDDRTFEVVMSTADEDRQGDELDQSKWDLKYFTMNPVVLWAHNYGSFPIGIVEDIRIESNKAIATGKFAPAGVNPEADMAAALYQEKILRTVSPGYIQNDDGTRELLELSFCPVPAGRYALSLRQVSRLGVSTGELISKGFFFDEKAIEQKKEAIGDHCEQDDGTPGVLAEGDSPGVLICVPTEDKTAKANESDMNKELIKQFTAEHERHGTAVAKAIDEFSASDKSIEEFEKAIGDEQADHLEKCTKAIDENYELEDQKKSIDEFKSAIQDEHLTHVKAVDKAIDEFKSAHGAADGEDDQAKAIEEFTKSAGTELDRHQTASIDLCKAEMGEGESDEAKAVTEKGDVAEELAEDEVFKQKAQKLDHVYEVFYAFTSAYMDETIPVDDFEKLLDEAVALMKGSKEKSFVAGFVGKAGASISAKNKEKINTAIKALETHHESFVADHQKSTNDVIASLKDLIGPPKEDEGKEPQDEKSAAPKQRSSTSGAAPHKKASASEDLEAYLFAQRLVRQIKTASENGLRQINDVLAEKYRK